MMKPQMLAAILSATALPFSVALLSTSSNEAAAPRKDSSGLSKMLSESKAAAIVQGLKTISKEQGWSADLARIIHDLPSGLISGRLISLRSTMSAFYIVVLRSRSHEIPGDDIISLTLLTEQGRYLDDLSCGINSRLTVQDSGQFTAHLATLDEFDHADIVVQLLGVSLLGNFEHSITHAGKSSSYRWADFVVGGKTALEKNGLCRVRISNNRFKLSYPGLMDMK